MRMWLERAARHGRGGTAKRHRRRFRAARHRHRPGGQRLRRRRSSAPHTNGSCRRTRTTWPRRWRTSASGSFRTTAAHRPADRSQPRLRVIHQQKPLVAAVRASPCLLISWVYAHNMNALHVTSSMPCVVHHLNNRAVRRGCTHVRHRNRRQHGGRDHRGGRDDRAVQVQSGRVLVVGSAYLGLAIGLGVEETIDAIMTGSATSWPRSAC